MNMKPINDINKFKVGTVFVTKIEPRKLSIIKITQHKTKTANDTIRTGSPIAVLKELDTGKIYTRPLASLQYCYLTILNEIEKPYKDFIAYVNKRKPNNHIRCKKCGNLVLTSDMPGYAYQCLFCDKDMHTSDTYESISYSKTELQELYKQASTKDYTFD